MPRPEKVQAVENIREQVDEARATFITEYRGLTVAEQQQLRRDIRHAQGEYRVLKMSLARRAVEDMEVEGLTDLLAGPTALAFASTDPVPVAKALKDFASEHENLVIKGGLLAGALLPPEQISRLAEIESREVLLGRIAGGFKSPMSKLAGMLGAKMRDAASMFSQLLEKKETEEPAPAADAAAEAEEVPAAEVEEVPEAEAVETAEAEEVLAAEVEEAPEAEAVETAEAEEVLAAEVEETPAAEVEEVPEAEAVKTAEAAEAPATAVEEAPEAEAEETSEPEEKPKKKAAPKAKAEESPEAETEAAPSEKTEPKPKKKAAPKAKAEESPEAETEAAPSEKTEPKPKKKAAPKAKAEESPVPADADEPTASDTDETAEEE